MKISNQNLAQIFIKFGRAKKISYANGGFAYVFKRENTHIQKINRQCSFSPINRNEPMTKTSYKRMLNRKFGKLIELDLDNDKCLSVTLTIRSEEYNTYEKISNRFKQFTNSVRFHKKVAGSYVGTARFIEVQEKGFFHVHCILLFNTNNIAITWKDLHRIWGWGFVRITEVYFVHGLYDYLTNPKHGANNKNASKFTRYPKGAKIIYISPNLPKGKSQNEEITDKQYFDLVNDENCFGFVKAHKYIDYKTQKIRTSIDKSVLIKMPPKKEVSENY